MKKILLVITLLASLSVQSQTQGIAIYKMELESIGSKAVNEKLEKEDPRQYALFKRMDDGAIKVAEQLEYELVFNGQQSRFEMREMMAVGSSDPFVRVANAASQGTFFNDLEQEERFVQRDAFGQELLVQLHPLEWEITNEIATVRGFSCRKAKTEKIVPGRDGIIRYPVEAWFTTEIPLNFGPVGFAGLPGLIVELNLDNRKFYLKELKEKENISIKEPTGKKIGTKEFYGMFSKAMGNMAPIN